MPGGGDAFAVELNPSLGGAAQLRFSTFIGGSGSDWGRAIAFSNGHIYVTGGTQSPNFLISHNATQESCGDPGCALADAFITVFNPAAPTPSGALVFSSYFGANDSETGAGVGVDSAGNFTAVGASSSSNLPTTSNALKASCPTCAGSAQPHRRLQRLDSVVQCRCANPGRGEHIRRCAEFSHPRFSKS